MASGGAAAFPRRNNLCHCRAARRPGASRIDGIEMNEIDSMAPK